MIVDNTPIEIYDNTLIKRENLSYLLPGAI